MYYKTTERRIKRSISTIFTSFGRSNIIYNMKWRAVFHATSEPKSFSLTSTSAAQNSIFSRKIRILAATKWISRDCCIEYLKAKLKIRVQKQWFFIHKIFDVAVHSQPLMHDDKIMKLTVHDLLLTLASKLHFLFRIIFVLLPLFERRIVCAVRPFAR